MLIECTSSSARKRWDEGDAGAGKCWGVVRWQDGSARQGDDTPAAASPCCLVPWHPRQVFNVFQMLTPLSEDIKEDNSNNNRDDDNTRRATPVLARRAKCHLFLRGRWSGNSRHFSFLFHLSLVPPCVTGYMWGYICAQHSSACRDELTTNPCEHDEVEAQCSLYSCLPSESYWIQVGRHAQ